MSSVNGQELPDYLQTERCWAEISRANLRHNLRLCRSLIPAGTRLCAVIKADAYGHGAAVLAAEAEAAGADFFAVATVPEAMELRTAGASLPLLILGPSPVESASWLAAQEVRVTLSSLEAATAFSQALAAAGAGEKTLPPLRVHIKLDTGMSRHGFPTVLATERQATLAAIAAIGKLPGLEVEGLYTHFATADRQDNPCYLRQQERFLALRSELQQAGLLPPIVHCANSATLSSHPQLAFDMVRAGIALYGARDGAWMRDLDLHPVMTLKARLSAIHTLHKGESVSYGAAYTAATEMPVGVLEIGYADGLHRLLSGKAVFSLHGKPLQQIGHICMDRCMVDLRAVPQAQVGDVAVIWGRDGADQVDVDDLAAEAGTIGYELLCGLTARVPRIYK